MTLVDEIDLELDAAPVPAPPQRAQRWWLAATGGFIAGALLVVTVVALPRAVSSVAAPVQHRIAFTLGGNVAASRGVVITSTGEHVQESATVVYDSPSLAVLAATSTKDGQAMCRIAVDGALGSQAFASAGKVALCVWSAAR